ncbi:MAG: DUF3168 domain-containing protein [Pseudomonadota bacterium]
MSALLYLPAQADADLASALLSALREDQSVVDAFGPSPRVFDNETSRAMYPFAALESHETEDASFVGVQARLHRISLATASRSGGITQARRLIDALSTAADSARLSLPGQTLVYCYSVYSDVVRPPDREHFRGLLRLKLLTRATAQT